jgi:hypothetical protein
MSRWSSPWEEHLIDLLYSERMSNQRSKQGHVEFAKRVNRVPIPQCRIRYSVPPEAWRTTLSPAADFINACPRGEGPYFRRTSMARWQVENLLKTKPSRLHRGSGAAMGTVGYMSPGQLRGEKVGPPSEDRICSASVTAR